MGTLAGREILECRLTNGSGTEAGILTLGATLRRLLVADARGDRDDIVLGFDTAEEYLRGRHYFGATLGRYANRIAGGSFSLAGRRHQLTQNDGPNCEHGGIEGFDRRLWTVDSIRHAHGAAVCLSLVSPDGDQGFPGELRTQVTYTLTDDDALRIDYRATASAATVVNLAHHSYWNLAGAAAGDALHAQLSIDADSYTPVDTLLIPTGELRPVAGSVFDFRSPQFIDSRIRDASEPQLRVGRGYDHNFVLRGAAGLLRRAARLEDPRSGRVLEVLTTAPGLQLYTGNFVAGSGIGKGRRLYREGDGVALEAQHFPDSPNQPGFPSTVLEPGALWTSSTVFVFSARSTPP